MAKIVLGKRPTSFKRTVKFNMLDGSEGAIEVSYRYRTRTEYGEFLDTWQQQRQELIAKERAEKAKKREQERKDAEAAGIEQPFMPEFTSGDLQRRIAEATADFLLAIADGWNLEGSEFARENLVQLADELPAAAAAIQDTYLHAITEGRLGN